MSVDIMSEADTRFIADNMLTADDFDLSESLDISALARISQELQLYRQNLQGSEEDQSFRALSNFLKNEDFLWESAAHPADLNFKEIMCDVSCNLDCDQEIKVELSSPNPSPGSTSGYSSHGSWNEEISVTEIEVPESEFSESPPDSPPAFVGSTALHGGAHVPPNCSAPLIIPTQNLVLNPVPISSVPKPKVPIQKAKSGVREIQPKAVKRKLQMCSPQAANNRPLILTPEEFSQLTASSVSLQQTPFLITSLTHQQQQQQPQTKITDSGRESGLTFSIKTDILPSHTDVKALKRQQRMIRNRESAFLSRKKRREYVQNLEQHLSDINQEKARLLSENLQLKERIKNLENENKKLKMIFPTTTVKKTTCLMAVIFMLAVNLTPFSLLSGGGLTQKSPVSSVNRYGRNLLWSSELQETGGLPIRLEDDLAQNLHSFKSPSLKNASSCPTFVNSTEALRLEKELRGWAMRVEKQKQKPAPQPKLHKKLHVPMPRLHTLLQSRTQRYPINVVQRDLEVYSAPHSLYEDLFDALDRRDDTFYFVSFSGDHLLLPASAHNRTHRPKMSLVMPAMTLNETTKENQVTMMQIDCEVMNMHIVEVKESAIPLHLRQKMAHSIHPPPTNTSSTAHTSPKTERSYRQKPTT